MGVENPVGLYIDGLNIAWPIGASDVKSEGDDHFRMLKQVLQNSFPEIAGPVNVTHTELNYLEDVTLGTAAASKVVTVSAGSAVTFNGITITDLGTVTTADINGGSVDGTVIGAAAAAAGTFTTLTANTALVADTISEKTADNGVAIDGLTLKDAGLALGSDADGDLYYRSGGALVRLGKGTKHQELVMNDGATAPEWGNMAVGANQVWSAPVRALNTEYKNETGRPIMVSVQLKVTATDSARTAVADVNSVSPATSGIQVGYHFQDADVSNDDSTGGTLTFIVPDDHFYQVSASFISLIEWAELS